MIIHPLFCKTYGRNVHHPRPSLLSFKDWLRCIEGPPGPSGGTPINVVNLSSRLMARWDEPEAWGNSGLSRLTAHGLCMIS